MPAVKAKFGESETILCFHGPLLYEAKVLKGPKIEKSGPNANQPHYFVHYTGWRKSWDEWVPETRVLKHNEENLKKQKQLKSNASTAKKNEKKRKAAETANDGDTPKGADKKRKTRHQVEHVQVNDEFKNAAEIKIPVPDDLKRQLVDDWDFVTRQKKLVGLPRTPTAHDILQKYIKDSNFKNYNLDVAKEVVEGLLTYFDHCLGTILLYRFERAQYIDILSKIEAKPPADEDGNIEEKGEGETTSLAGKKFSQIYGCEHLLRLFVKLPMVLAHTDLEEDNCKVLVDSFQDILKFMSRNAQEFFVQDYENASASHIRISA